MCRCVEKKISEMTGLSPVYDGAMRRSEMYRRVAAHSGTWDVIVIGGGAT